jgi:hypothetical protein
LWRGAIKTCGSVGRSADADFVVNGGAASTTSDAPIYIADRRLSSRGRFELKVTNFRSAADMVAPLGAANSMPAPAPLGRAL